MTLSTNAVDLPPEIDDASIDILPGDFAAAAAGYATAASFVLNGGTADSHYTANDPPESWPPEWLFMPKDPRGMLVRSIDLLQAEIRRIDSSTTLGKALV